MSAVPASFVHAASPRLERAVARLSGAACVALHDFAARIGEAELENFSIVEMCEAEEHNATLLEEELAAPAWRAAIARAARRARVDPAVLDVVCRQKFLLAHGRRLTQLREILAIERDAPVAIATDIPPALVAQLKKEQRWGAARLRVLGGTSAVLRTCAFFVDLARIAALHAAAAVRILQLAALPARPTGESRRYAAWIGAEPPEMSGADPHSFSLPGFLAEALQGAKVSEIVVQGAPPAAPLPGGLLYRRSRFAMRWRPAPGAIAAAIFAQIRQLLCDLADAADWRSRQLIAPFLAAVPGVRLWFESDPPVAVLYPNSAIGAEPAAALIGREFNVASMMVFYSANVAHWVKPAMPPAAGDLEPEIRCIAADRIGMWSKEMRSAFLAAGYAAERLPVTGVVNYGRQAGFAPSSRFASGGRSGPVRLGVFDVSTVQPGPRFMAGWGQTLYHSHFREAFFSDLIDAARKQWQDDFVVVRKLKRRLSPGLHAEDVDLEQLLPAARIVAPAPDTSLWSVLAQVDLVVCMPFTSVAYMADHYGIPAAYYDPTCVAKRTSLAGRAPLLSGRAALDAWLCEPTLNPGYDPRIVVASETLKAACGGAWREPRPLAPHD